MGLGNVPEMSNKIEQLLSTWAKVFWNSKVTNHADGDGRIVFVRQLLRKQSCYCRCRLSGIYSFSSLIKREKSLEIWKLKCRNTDYSK